MSTFQHTQQEYKSAMDVMDQDGAGQEANIDDIKRVMRTYSKNMSEEQIEDYLKKHNKSSKAEHLMNIHKRLTVKRTANDMESLQEMMMGQQSVVQDG